MIKLIASDLDGTLLKEGTMDINPEIYDIIRKLKAKGIVFAAVSGREYDSIERVFAPVKDDIYFIAGNGGIISYQGEIIEKMAIPADILKEVVEYVRAQEGASFMTAGSAQAYVERADQAFVKKLREGYKLHVNEVDDVLNVPETMTKVAMYNEEVDAALGAEEAKRRLEIRFRSWLPVITGWISWMCIPEKEMLFRNFVTVLELRREKRLLLSEITAMM